MGRTSGGFAVACSVMLTFAIAACSSTEGATTNDSTTPTAGSDAATAAVVPIATTPEARLAQVQRGRLVTLSHGCGGCHGGGANPDAEGFLAGVTSPIQEFKIGPCYLDPNAKPCFVTRPRNLTPDNTTGLGRFTERQIFNALRYGLRPGETPDVEITSTTPGQGNFPANPKYLAIPMPWPEWRHMSDQELWDIAAYLKYGVKPVVNKVADSEGPPDFWASEYTVAKIGAYPLPAFPTAREKTP